MSGEAWWKCSWCNHWFTIGGIKKSPPPEILGETASHGICRECKAKELAKIPQLILSNN